MISTHVVFAYQRENSPIYNNNTRICDTQWTIYTFRCRNKYPYEEWTTTTTTKNSTSNKIWEEKNKIYRYIYRNMPNEKWACTFENHRYQNPQISVYFCKTTFAKYSFYSIKLHSKYIFLFSSSSSSVLFFLFGILDAWIYRLCTMWKRVILNGKRRVAGHASTVK